MTRLISIREKRILCRLEVTELLGDQICRDCIAAGWLKPCVEKQNGRRNRSLYALRDIETCEARMEQGEYPQP